MTLVILAAGMGSRYGGMKQIDPINDDGNFIIDFSIYDAIQAGFTKVVFTPSTKCIKLPLLMRSVSFTTVVKY